jgi:hypothetical protein
MQASVTVNGPLTMSYVCAKENSCGSAYEVAWRTHLSPYGTLIIHCRGTGTVRKIKKTNNYIHTVLIGKRSRSRRVLVASYIKWTTQLGR